jgi:hypothetical protein
VSEHDPLWRNRLLKLHVVALVAFGMLLLAAYGLATVGMVLRALLIHPCG